MREKHIHKMRSYTMEDIQKILAIVDSSDDRSAVILSAAFVEQLLGLAIENMLRPDLSSEFLAKLFDGYGVIASFSAKIDLAYALGLIEKDVADEMGRMKNIRNHFSHSLKAHSLSDGGDIFKACQELKFWSDECAATIRERDKRIPEARLRWAVSFAMLATSIQDPLDLLPPESP